ncbi:hypothetical protein L6452_40424 [Arctium lappa]|uniref:Uncharacterized protein n=1 Tax=Arctium lappa TaxID=4217 RepID=A0ACB8XML8_ARCLA|nr:hypothetical protein L6452_40424 [Arctium lappa]
MATQVDAQSNSNASHNNTSHVRSTERNISAIVPFPLKPNNHYVDLQLSNFSAMFVPVINVLQNLLLEPALIHTKKFIPEQYVQQYWKNCRFIARERGIIEDYIPLQRQNVQKEKVQITSTPPITVPVQSIPSTSTPTITVPVQTIPSTSAPPQDKEDRERESI